MSRLGRRSSFSGASRRCKSIPPLIGLLSETEPPACAAHTPCTSGCPSASRAGGHGLATAGLAAPSPPCPAAAIAADKMRMLIARDSVRRRVLMCALLVREGRDQLDVTLQRRAGVDGCQWERYLHAMHRNLVLAAASLGAASAVIWTAGPGVVTGQTQERAAVPKFQYDPTFPQPLPEN